VKRKTTITIVGAGRLGQSLAVALSQAGYAMEEIVTRERRSSREQARKLASEIGARSTSATGARLSSKVIWFCVSDREIANAARSLAEVLRDWKEKIALHSSGALGAAELNLLKRRGAAIASVHPMMTFVSGSQPSLRGVPFALEGDISAVRVAEKIVRDLGGESFTLGAKRKPAYHAWGAFASPLLVAALVIAEEVAKLAGVQPTQARRRMMPIIRQTVENYAQLGPAGAFSGPLIRGDVGVVRSHLKVLRRSPAALEAYLALARIALRHLPTRRRSELKKLVGGGLR
jgi:predicted short-subunit dehydrogenase-like oxidoreductase (DUF2520 family)